MSQLAAVVSVSQSPQVLVALSISASPPQGCVAVVSLLLSVPIVDCAQRLGFQACLLAQLVPGERNLFAWLLLDAFQTHNLGHSIDINKT